jgi:hypothetical protein
MTTIEAMKQALHLLRWTHFGECRTYPGPVLDPREVDKMLGEAIAESEKAKGEKGPDQPGNCGPLTPAGIAASMMDLVDLMGSDPASTKEVDPRAWDHLLVYAPKPTGERAALIEKLQWAAKVGGDAILHVGGADTLTQAADMLAADAQEIEKWKKQSVFEKDLADVHWNERVRLEAQQVAEPPPTGWDNGLSQDYCKGLGQWLANRQGARQQLREMLADTTGAVMVEYDIGSESTESTIRQKLIDLGWTPPGADHVEDVRAMVQMTDLKLDDLLPTNDSMSRSDSLRWMARATERKHGIK